jgi:Mg2+ and Co2+ transporter CorA
MNFDIIPELHWELGYMYFWIVAIAIIVVCIALLKWKKVI